MQHVAWCLLEWLQTWVQSKTIEPNHACRAGRHCSSWLIFMDWLRSETATKIFVSSAYCGCSRPKEETIWAIGEVYREESRGPSTEPCGTSVGQGKIGDREYTYLDKLSAIWQIWIESRKDGAMDTKWGLESVKEHGMIYSRTLRLGQEIQVLWIHLGRLSGEYVECKKQGSFCGIVFAICRLKELKLFHEIIWYWTRASSSRSKILEMLFRSVIRRDVLIEAMFFN